MSTIPVPQPERVELEVLQQDAGGVLRWRPQVGEETLFLLDSLGFQGEARERILTESAGILARCVAPSSSAETQTGLVIGNVQSGKTLSFTSVAALARDNRFRVVIVITGVSVGLFNQSTQRLVNDLQLMTRQQHGQPRKWKHFPNPSLRGDVQPTIQSTLDEWEDRTVPERELQTVLITVMKNHRRLAHLTNVLGQLRLGNAPTLIIDDEADQAGLNSLVNQQDESTTYKRLLELRNAVPHHTYLQYTATPQAPLLINIIDRLSPNFAELLTPGSEYVGGRDFFVDRTDLIRIIPQGDLPVRGTVMSGPPDSLLFAMRLFFLGVAASLVQEQAHGNRSMLVHPSQGTMRHSEYFQWIRSAKNAWQRALGLPEGDPDRSDVIVEFEEAYRDLAQTVPDVPPFDVLLTRLVHAIRRTREQEVNARAGRTPPVLFHDTPAHILVGGQAMDRGFTVEGLTVTYMPRGVGVGNADTVQQRARFFGYKRRYLGYCRVFLEADTRDAYSSYVRHEEHMREQLRVHRERGEPLAAWKRTFLLAPNLQPTRDEVMDLGYMRYNFSNDWYAPKVPHELPDVTQANRDLVARFVGTLALQADAGDARRTAMQVNLGAHGVPLGNILERLLMQFKVMRQSESQRFTALRIQLRQILERNPRAVATLYVMSRGVNPAAVRERPVTATGELTTYLFQGANPSTGYPGDRELPAAESVRVQIHHLRLVHEGQIVADDVPALGIALPDGLRDDVVVQHRTLAD